MTFLYEGDIKKTMAPSSVELLERAWQQLELENPESVDKLRLLKTEQGDGQKLKRGTQQPQEG